jgi:hypothetical protein
MTTVTGRYNYVTRRVQQLIKQGYQVVRQHQHPDNTLTVTLER